MTNPNQWRTRKINTPEEATHPIKLSDLKVKYENACHEVHGKGTDRTVTYRLGMVTPIGNIERSCWEHLAMRAAKRELGEVRVNELLEELTSFLIHIGEDKRLPEGGLNIEALKILAGNLHTSETWHHYEAYTAYCKQKGNKE